jgi:tripartite-type tricarboxylate transporter receptor subunit TctC
MKTCTRWFSIFFGAAVAIAGSLSAASAQGAEDVSSYPSKVIKIIVPFTPSGPNDILARMVADELTAKWKANVVVDNRPGGGTIIGTQVVARAPADGYTLLVVSLSTATNISLKKSLPYDTLHDFTPVVRLAESSNVLVANLDAPIHSVSDLVALAKTSPGQISYAIGGVGSATDLASHLIQISTGTKMNGVPYRGDGPALIDLLGGRISWMFGTILSVMPYIQENKIRAIAVTGSKRVDALPNVPTMAETVPNFDASSFYGLFAPAGTPPAIVAKLNGAIDEILKTEKVRTFLEQQGTKPVGGDAAAFGTFFKAEVDKWAKVIKAAGIEIQ